MTPEAKARLERVHELKTWPDPFAAVRDGSKPWELRYNDRDFQVGDILRLREWSPEVEDYSGAVEERRVTWMLVGPAFGLPAGYVIMSLASAPAAPVGSREEIAPDGYVLVPREIISPLVRYAATRAIGTPRKSIDEIVEFVTEQFLASAAPSPTPADPTSEAVREALEAIRVFAQDCIINTSDRATMGNLMAIRDEADKGLASLGGDHG